MANERSLNKEDACMESFPQEAQCEEINPARSLLQGSRHFLCKRLPKLGNETIAELIAVIRHNKQSAQPGLQNREDVLSQLDTIPLSQLSDYVDSEVRKMEGADANWSQKRRDKRTTRFQDFAVTFSRFLRAYSGIVDIVGGVDHRFGYVAFATLSLLFATVKMKAEAEESIHISMRQISDYLPDCSVYQRIYRDPALHSMLAEAYKDVILFAREVTVYFQGPGFVRYTRHMLRVTEFQVMEQRMRENFNRIRIKCEVLLSEQVEHLIKHKALLDEKIDHLVKENQALHERENAKIVKEMRETLELHNYRTEDMRKNLKQYRKILRHNFDNDTRRKRMDLEEFLKTEDGKDWESPGSKVMVLFGRNEGSSSTHHSWLSPVAADLAEGLLNSDNPVAYEECCPSKTLDITISLIIFQLLERNPVLIRRAHDYREIESQISRKGNGDEKISTLRTALLRIINLHNSRVCIILNRPELSAGSLPRYITTMLSLTKDSTIELKILLVMRTEFWDFEKNESEINTHGLDARMFRAVCMDQPRR